MNLSEEYTLRPRVRLWGQPIGLGGILTCAGAVLTLIMVLAFDPQEHWLLSLATILMGLASMVIFCSGIRLLLTPFQKVWINRREILVTLFGIRLRRIPVKDIYSVTATTREILLRNKEHQLYRLSLNVSGEKRKPLWIDWSVDTELALKQNLPDTNFLF